MAEEAQGRNKQFHNTVLKKGIIKYYISSLINRLFQKTGSISLLGLSPAVDADCLNTSHPCGHGSDISALTQFSLPALAGFNIKVCLSLDLRSGSFSTLAWVLLSIQTLLVFLLAHFGHLLLCFSVCNMY